MSLAAKIVVTAMLLMVYAAIIDEERGTGEAGCVGCVFAVPVGFVIFLAWTS